MFLKFYQQNRNLKQSQKSETAKIEEGRPQFGFLSYKASPFEIDLFHDSY